MKALLVALLALAASVGLALFLREDVGYVMISYGHWTIEVSLALFLVLDFSIFAALYMALRSFFGVRSVPRRMHNWRANRLISKAQIAMTQGTIELAEGNLKQAEKHLLSHVGESKILSKKLDKVASTSTMHKNTAARVKSRMAKRLHAMDAK